MTSDTEPTPTCTCGGAGESSCPGCTSHYDAVSIPKAPRIPREERDTLPPPDGDDDLENGATDPQGASKSSSRHMLQELIAAVEHMRSDIETLVKGYRDVKRVTSRVERLERDRITGSVWPLMISCGALAVSICAFAGLLLLINR